MKQQTYIHIPEPCHENWDNMTPEGRGRFCASCAKTVVDFTSMTDMQVLNYLSNIKDSACGRFRDDQLERGIHEDAKKKKSRWQWALAAMAAFSLTNKLAAQSSKRDITPPPITEKKDTDVVITVGMVLPRIVPEQKEEQIKIKGIVRDITGMPLPDAIITIDNKTHISSDKYGQFSFEKPNKKKHVATISVAYIGYKTEQLSVNYDKSNALVVITLSPSEQKLGEVTVVAYPSKGCGHMLGGVSMIRSVTIKDTLIADFKKSVGLTSIYPNPAPKGSQISINLKSAGDYAFQFMSDSGAFINQQTANGITAKQTVLFTIPASIAAGNYYLRIINNTTKKQTTEKIIVL